MWFTRDLILEEWSDVDNDKQGWMSPHSETHPKVKEMMREYYDNFDHIMGSNRRWCRRADVNNGLTKAQGMRTRTRTRKQREESASR